MSDYEIELYRILGEMLREERIKRDLTLEQVAEYIEMTPKTVQRYEQGERKIKIGTIIKICQMFNIDSNDLMANAKARLTGSFPVTGFYLDEETKETAQEIFENDKILFDAYRSVNKDKLVAFAKKLEELRKMEEGDI